MHGEYIARSTWETCIKRRKQGRPEILKLNVSLGITFHPSGSSIAKIDGTHMACIRGCKVYIFFLILPNHPYYWLRGAQRYHTKRRRMGAESVAAFCELPPDTRWNVKEKSAVFAVPLRSISVKWETLDASKLFLPYLLNIGSKLPFFTHKKIRSERIFVESIRSAE